MAQRPQSYAEFWPLYLSLHGRPATRALHYAGTVAGLIVLAVALVARQWWLLPAAVAIGYGIAWTGHLIVERNLPATFGHPLWSLASDVRMLALAVTGRLGRELRRHGLT